MTGAFQKFWDLGYRRLLPVIPPSVPLRNAGKRPGYKNGSGEWHGRGVQEFEASEKDLAAWEAMGAGVGLRTGRGLAGLDIDTLDEEWAARIEALAFEVLGAAPVRIGRAPKRLLLYRVADDCSYRALRFADGASVRPAVVEWLAGDGKWFVIDGIHPSTGKPYRWESAPVPADLLVYVRPSQIEDFYRRLGEMLPSAQGRAAAGPGADRSLVNQQGLAGEASLIEAALAAVPNAPGMYVYDEWVKFAAALRASVDYETGLRLFEEFSARGAHEEEKEDPDRVFGSLNPPFELGAHWIFDKAEAQGWLGRIEQWFEPIDEGVGPLFPESAPNPKKRFEPVFFDDAGDSALLFRRPPLIKGLLSQGSMTVLYGESGAGKTFVAMDMAWHVAAGLPWAGMRTTQAGVVYVAAEGGDGARARAAAIQKACKRRGVPFWFILSPVDLLRRDGDVAALIEAVRAIENLPNLKKAGLSVGLVILDTLSRAMSGGDENSSEDMGALVKHLDAIRSAVGAHVLVIHHTGKDRARGARGHSLLRAATDTEIEVGDGQIAVTKQRDMEQGFASAFELEQVELGTDADGDPVTSAIVRLTTPQEATPGVPSPREAEVLEALSVLQAVDGAGASMAALTDSLRDRGDDFDSKKLAVYVRRLAGKNLIRPDRSGRWFLCATNNIQSYFEVIDSDVFG